MVVIYLQPESRNTQLVLILSLGNNLFVIGRIVEKFSYEQFAGSL